MTRQRAVARDCRGVLDVAARSRVLGRAPVGVAGERRRPPTPSSTDSDMGFPPSIENESVCCPTTRPPRGRSREVQHAPCAPGRLKRRAAWPMMRADGCTRHRTSAARQDRRLARRRRPLRHRPLLRRNHRPHPRRPSSPDHNANASTRPSAKNTATCGPSASAPSPATQWSSPSSATHIRRRDQGPPHAPIRRLRPAHTAHGCR